MTGFTGMMQNSGLRRFWQDESGAVTVDWVVLTAGVVALTMIVVSFFTPEIYQAAAETLVAYIDEAKARP